LFHAPGDDIVPVLNAQKAYSTLLANGATVLFVPLGDAATNHSAGSQLYLAAMITALTQ